MANALLVKEVRLSLRQMRAAVLQLVFFGACFLVAYMLWPQGGVYSRHAQQGHELFTVMCMLQLTLVALFAPAFTSTSLTTERERNTLDSIYCTLLRPDQIIFGKIAGSLTFLLLVVLSGIPIMGVCLMLGGVATGDVVMFYVVTLLTALAFGMLGLTISSFCRKTYMAVLITYAVIVVFSGGVLLPALLLKAEARGLSYALLHYIQSLSPFAALGAVVLPGISQARGHAPSYGIFIVYAVAACVVLAVILTARLRKCAGPQAQSSAVRKATIGRRIFFLIDPRRRRRMIGPLMNAVMIKELRTMVFGKMHYVARLGSVCLILSVALMLAAALSYGLSERATQLIPVLTVSMQATLFVFLVPVFSATLISGEIEGERFDLLRLTRLSALSIVVGKFLAVLLPLLFLLLVTLPPYALLILIEQSPGMRAAIARSIVTLVAMVTFMSAVGLFFSSLSRRTSFSIGGAYVVVVLTCVLGLVGLLRLQGFSRGMLRAMFVVNPVVTVLREVAMPQLSDFQLWRPNLVFLLGSTVLLLAFTVVRMGQLIRPD